MPQVSVVIAVRNGEKYIAEAVRSALGQGDAVGEVIVIDDHSSDGTAAVCEGIDDPRIAVFRQSEGRSGVSAARNAGFARARYDWVMFLDADDRLHAGAIAALWGDGPADGTAAIYGDYRRITAEGQPMGSRGFLKGRQKPSGDVLERLLAGNIIVNGGVMLVRRSMFAETSAFDKTLSRSEDWHAWCLLASRGSFEYRKGVVVLDYRVHGASAMAIDASVEPNMPALEAIYAAPAIVAAVPEDVRQRQRRVAESHLKIYALSQAVRLRGMWAAVPEIVGALRQYPDRAVPILVKTLGAAAGF